MLPQRHTNLADGGVDAVLGIDKNIFAPKPFDDLLAGGDTAFFFRKQDQKLGGDAFQFLNPSVPPQFEAGAIQLKISELVDPARHSAPRKCRNYSIDLLDLHQTPAPATT